MERSTDRAVENVARHRFVELFVRVRLYAAPAVAFLAALAALEGPLWRTVSLLSVSGVVLTLSIFEHRHFRRTEDLKLGIAANLAALLVGQAIVITGTGGLASPLMPGVVLFGVIGGLFGPRPFIRWMPIVFHVPWLAALAWLHVHAPPEDFIPSYLEGWLVVGRGTGPWIVAAVFSLFVLGAPRVGQRLREVMTRAYADLGTARERELELHRSQRSELESLTGELARDLEMPLAGMVDLSTRLERELGDGGTREKAQGHVRVLRTEMDRMRAIIAELVDFARPVSPLELKEHDLEALVRELVLLYQRVLEERSLTVSIESHGRTVAPIDKRKIRTVLMNLIQNAVEASPPGAEIAIALSAGHQEVRIEVRDSGPGLAPAVEGKAMEPGVTTKESRSGLGLTIARTLVRQHDGRLELKDDEGLAAIVHLPRQRP